jgi:hypothetical protein
MKVTNKSYMVSFEILNALLLAIGLFMIFSFFCWLVYNFAFNQFGTNIFQLLHYDTIAPTFASGIFMMAMLLILEIVWSIFILIVSLLQYNLLAVPIANYMSAGLERDAKRSWAFYIVNGALIGGGPWWVLGYFMFDSRTDSGSLVAVLAPGLMIGLFSGAILKRRLVRLASAMGIENSLV